MTGAARATASRAERRKQETRDRILAAAEAVFLRLGFDAATTGEIADAADVGAGTFYLHFRDKRDAFETLCRRAAREVIERWRERVSSDLRSRRASRTGSRRLQTTGPRIARAHGSSSKAGRRSAARRTFASSSTSPA